MCRLVAWLALALVVVVVAAAAPGVARAQAAEEEEETQLADPEAAKPFRPQNNEVAFTADAVFARPSSTAHLTLSYSWLPGAIDRNDEVIPALRRFVRHPTELFVRIDRHSDPFESGTGLFAGGRYALGMLHGAAEIGFDYIEVENDAFDSEGNYFDGSLALELVARPTALFGIGAFYEVRPVLFQLESESLGTPAERSGQSQAVGAAIGLATPNDRLLLDARLGWRGEAYDFAGFQSGHTGISGWFTDTKLTFNVSPSIGFYVLTIAAYETWQNNRIIMGGIQPDALDLDEFEDVLSIDVELGYVYWFEGRWGFRVALGGGYVGPRPVFDGERESGRLRLGVGFTSRY